MTPTWHGPLSTGPAGFALVLGFGAGFLAGGLAGAPVCAGVAAGTGWVCAQADAAKHDRNATTKALIMKTWEI
jgi:hypothetical protein